MKCAWKTCPNEVSGRRRFCDIRCKRKFFVDKRRKDLKFKAIAAKGGGCARCGYVKCEAALTFHHLEPEGKDFSVSGHGLTRSWAKLSAELEKCELLCANCHAEIRARQHAPERPGV